MRNMINFSRLKTACALFVRAALAIIIFPLIIIIALDKLGDFYAGAAIVLLPVLWTSFLILLAPSHTCEGWGHDESIKHWDERL